MGTLTDAVGHALRGIRSGPEHAISAQPEIAKAPMSLHMTSSAFSDGATLPVAYTADGAGLSPPLAWTHVPPGAGALVLVIEDVDSPTPAPLVHAIVANLPGGDGGLSEGALSADPSDKSGPVPEADRDGNVVIGRNSFLSTKYLAPAPVPGHGPHRYLFQLFALAAPLALTAHPGRGALVDALQGRVIARGLLTGVFERA